MKTRFYDLHDGANPANGAIIEGAPQLRAVLQGVRDRPPFFAELIGDNGYMLLLGLGADRCCAQFSAADGSPPYLMAVALDAGALEGELEFLTGNTPSPVPARYCLPCSAVAEIAEEFVQSGRRKSDVIWEEI
jgi:hypothetical protein